MNTSLCITEPPRPSIWHRRTCCKAGHEYTAENTRVLSDGSRQCRFCDAERKQKYRDAAHPDRPKFKRDPATFKTHCKRGHPLQGDGADLYTYQTKWGLQQRCRHCQRIRNGTECSLHYRLATRLRNRLASAIRLKLKTGSAVRLLGCSVPEAILYLESLFQPGMTWGNWSPKGWHIDHKKALAKFDLTDPVQLAEACHYSNLQPLWATENHRKGGR